ncbi:MAG TPA: hypothetical protein VIR00_02970, partial [Micromonosporaceae bacterium]
MATWPDPRAISVGFAFGHSQYEDPTGLTFEIVSPADDPDTGDDPGPALDDLTSNRGRLGDAGATQASEIDLKVRNDDGEFSPRNVSGPRYGTLLRGTWAQIGIDTGSGPEPLATASALGFTPTRTGPGIDPQVAVQAWGVLDRMGRDDARASAMRRFVEANPPDSFWAMEEGVLADQLAAGVTGDPALTIYGYVDPLTSLSGVGALAPWLLNGVLLNTGTFIAAPRTNPLAHSWTMDWLYNIAAARGDKLSISFLMFDGMATATPGSTPNISVRMFGSAIGGGNAGTVKIGFPNTNTAAASATLPGTAMQGNTLHHVRLQAVDNNNGTYTLSSWL